ncbi:cation:proton antiporter [Planctomycetes bacterium K23_9]|uniref:Glutathione-regulated potassium-efflux system protein KefC n=1 Tax=Stieleria marina TaxID=1930275 RepID=A0A517NRQ2_9BACT|nr:Glutathione-regulated potassium-efflux system protein KefC [Planctomycetes bacterium K23_9]
MEQAAALVPAILLLVIGIVSIVCMRRIGLSPIVGYMIGGLLIGEHALGLIHESESVHLLAELGVVFLLFDIGLHFSVRHIWEVRRDIFGLGPIQIALCTAAFAGIAIAFGFSLEIALIVGGALALSSTAVVQPTLAERNQVTCPVGQTSTAVLIFQDVFAIFLLILAASLSGGDEPSVVTSLPITIVLAATKGLAALALAIMLGRVALRPLFAAVSRTKNEEIFTAIALLIVLATASASGAAGLSLTLGAFLGGMMLSETPFRHLIRTEAKPFRDLLLAFFFISIGMTLDWHILLGSWWQILIFTGVTIAIKAAAISASAKVVGWSVPGSLQLGFMLAQGSEFVFVIVSIPAVRSAFGEQAVGVVFIGVAISLALTPTVAELGSRLARAVKKRSSKPVPETETTRIETIAPVVIFGMGTIGRTVANALEAHNIRYEAIDNDFERFNQASVDGFQVTFGDLSDIRLAHTMSMSERASIVITSVRFDRAKAVMPIVREQFPNLTRFTSVNNETAAAEIAELGMQPVIERDDAPGLAMAEHVLRSQGIDAPTINEWLERRRRAVVTEKPPVTA